MWERERKRPQPETTQLAECGCIQTAGMKELRQKGTLHCGQAVSSPTPSRFHVSSSQFHRPFLPHSLGLPASCLYRGKGTGGRSLPTCCGYNVFCKAPGLNTSVHCANSPQSLVFPFSEGPPLCGSLLWPSEGYCAAKRRGLAESTGALLHSVGICKGYIGAVGRHNGRMLKGNCKRMAKEDKSIKSGSHQQTNPESRTQVAHWPAFEGRFVWP